MSKSPREGAGRGPQRRLGGKKKKKDGLSEAMPVGVAGKGTLSLQNEKGVPSPDPNPVPSSAITGLPQGNQEGKEGFLCSAPTVLRAAKRRKKRILPVSPNCGNV